MINNEIIKIALNTKNVGLSDESDFKSSLKNSLCGDKIRLELIVKKSKINSMKYETESCVYCQASASLLARKIKNLNISIAVKAINTLKDVIKDGKFDFPPNFKDFKVLINKKNLSRISCINLPFDAVLKALK